MSKLLIDTSVSDNLVHILPISNAGRQGKDIDLTREQAIQTAARLLECAMRLSKDG